MVAQKTMSRWLSTFKIAEISPDATEVPLSIVRLNLPVPVSSEDVTADVVRQAMEDAGVLQPAAKVDLFFKDEEGDFVTLPSTKLAWPSCCISEGVLKAWFMRAPEPPATAPSTPVCACLGPHVHQPSQKRLQSLDQNEFQGYSLLTAAEEGCHFCVGYWLENGVDANFRSSTNDYTAMDFVLWSKKKSRISAVCAEQVKLVLENAGGRVNKM